MNAQDILENGLTVFEAHTDDPHQKLNGPLSMWNDLLDLDYIDRDDDVSDFNNRLEFDQIQPDDFFTEDCDPAGGYGLNSHI